MRFRFLPSQKHRRCTAGDLEGILLLSDKYCLETLYNQVVNIFSKDWPSELGLWDQNEDEIRLLVKHREQKHYYMDLDLPEPCLVIRMANSCNMNHILPAAFYHLSRIPLSANSTLNNILSVTNSNVSQDTIDVHIAYLGFGGWTASYAFLSTEDWQRLKQGKEAIQIFFSDVCDEAFRIALTHCVHCRAGDLVQADRRVTALHLVAGAYKVEVSLAHDPLGSMRFNGDRQLPPPLCLHCFTHFRAELDGQRERLWNQLPGFFGLPKN